jgi:hypothetical protein
MKSIFLSLNLNDLMKGCIVAIFAAVGMAIIPSLEAGTLPTLVMLQSAGVTGLAAGLAYLLKNFLSNSANKPFVSEKDVTTREITVPVAAVPAVQATIQKVSDATK